MTTTSKRRTAPPSLLPPRRRRSSLPRGAGADRRRAAGPTSRRVPDDRLRAAIAERLFTGVVRRLALQVTLPDGAVLGGGRAGDPVMRLVRPEAFYRRLGAGGLIGFGEAYMAGDWDADDLTGLLTVFAATWPR